MNDILIDCTTNNNKFCFHENVLFSFYSELLTPVYKHHNNTIRLTIQYKAALTTCEPTVIHILYPTSIEN